MRFLPTLEKFLKWFNQQPLRTRYVMLWILVAFMAGALAVYVWQDHLRVERWKSSAPISAEKK